MSAWYKKAIIHVKPNSSESWQFHGKEGWTIGTSMEHYRCYKCFIPETNRERDADTVDFIPNKIPFPKVSTDDYLRQIATDLLTILNLNQKCDYISRD